MKISNTGQKVGNTENSARKQRFLKSKTKQTNKKPRSIENEKLTESNKKHSRTGHQETWQAEGRMSETEDGGDGAWRPDISTGNASGKQASKHSETLKHRILNTEERGQHWIHQESTELYQKFSKSGKDTNIQAPEVLRNPNRHDERRSFVM